MLTINPQYIKDTAGKDFVVLSKQEFDSLIEELEELEDIHLYDKARKNDTGERITMEEAFKTIEAKRKK